MNKSIIKFLAATLSIAFSLFFFSSFAQAVDQCNFTSECRSLYGSTATDCLDSRSSSSVCMCGNRRCDSAIPPTPSPRPTVAPTPTSRPTPIPTPVANIDQCDTTLECKVEYGNSASDCANSRSSTSVCMCGNQRCDATDPNPPQEPGKLGRFVKAKDMLLANFDSKPDPDDIHSVAGLATMLRDARFAGIKYHAVSGAYGRQGGRYIVANNLFDMAFGASNWSDAHTNRTQALNEVYAKVSNVLGDGGDIWIQEAGQSDFSADLVRRIQAQMSGINTRVRIHIVQHSNWNQDQTTPADLSYVKNNTDYIKIPDGNGSGNGTPSYNTNRGNNWSRAKSDPEVGHIWREAQAIADHEIATTTGWKNGSILAGGMDFSDVVEDTWIFGFNYFREVDDFFDEFL